MLQALISDALFNDTIDYCVSRGIMVKSHIDLYKIESIKLICKRMGKTFMDELESSDPLLLKLRNGLRSGDDEAVRFLELAVSDSIASLISFDCDPEDVTLDFLAENDIVDLTTLADAIGGLLFGDFEADCNLYRKQLKSSMERYILISIQGKPYVMPPRIVTSERLRVMGRNIVGESSDIVPTDGLITRVEKYETEKNLKEGETVQVS